jgi:hypothetical protein
MPSGICENSPCFAQRVGICFVPSSGYSALRTPHFPIDESGNFPLISAFFPIFRLFPRNKIYFFLYDAEPNLGNFHGHNSFSSLAMWGVPLNIVGFRKYG